MYRFLYRCIDKKKKWGKNVFYNYLSQYTIQDMPVQKIISGILAINFILGKS